MSNTVNPILLLLRLNTLVVTFVISVIVGGYWWLETLQYSPNLNVLYSGILNLLSIATGFLASFYFFVVSRSTEFLSKISKTLTFNALLTLTRATLFLALISILVSLHISVREPLGITVSYLENITVVIWIILLALTIANFWRCIKLFNSLAR